MLNIGICILLLGFSAQRGPLGTIFGEVLPDQIGKASAKPLINQKPWVIKEVNFTGKTGSVRFQQGSRVRIESFEDYSDSARLVNFLGREVLLTSPERPLQKKRGMGMAWIELAPLKGIRETGPNGLPLQPVHPGGFHVHVHNSLGDVDRQLERPPILEGNLRLICLKDNPRLTTIFMLQDLSNISITAADSGH